MFERFDDPAGFQPGPGLRDAVRQRGRRLRRRRRLAVTGLSAAVVLVGAVGAGALYVERRDEAIDREELSTQPVTDGTTNVLLVGTDGAMDEGARADSLAVLRLDQTGAHLLSLPRDLADDAVGGRINEALHDGPQALIDAVERTTGIPIHHYVAIEPAGFVDLVDAVGGLQLSVDGTYRNMPTGVFLSPSDCTTLDGEAALALARARHLERAVAGGGWETDPSGDLGRIARQQRMLGAALDQLATDPATIDRLSRLLADHAVVDDGLDLAALVRLGTRLAAGPPLLTEAFPVEAATRPSGAQVLVPGPGAADVAAAYGAPPAPAGAPGVEDDFNPPPGFPAIGPCR